MKVFENGQSKLIASKESLDEADLMGMTGNRLSR